MDYLTKLFGLNGKNAVVIGAGGYLCGEMARALSKAGVKVAVLDRDGDSIKRVSAEINASGGQAIGCLVDVTDKKSQENALGKVVKEFGDFHILINGAGINAPTPFFDITLDEWNSILAVHITGTMLACQVFGRHMVNNKFGSVINMSSVSAGQGLSKAFTYSVAKAGIRNLTQNLAREWAPFNVRVNALQPGFFPTEWSRKNFIDKARNDAILNHTPMKRYGAPQELIGAVLWLCSNSASFVTGSQITVDGGFTATTI